MERPESDPDIPAYVRELRMINGLLRAELAHTRRLALRLADEAEYAHNCQGELCLLCAPCRRSASSGDYLVLSRADMLSAIERIILKRYSQKLCIGERRIQPCSFKSNVGGDSYAGTVNGSSQMLAFSRTTSFAFLSSLIPRKTGCRRRSSRVHSVNFTSQTIDGLTQIQRFISATVNPGSSPRPVAGRL